MKTTNFVCIILIASVFFVNLLYSLLMLCQLCWTIWEGNTGTPLNVQQKIQTNEVLTDECWQCLMFDLKYCCYLLLLSCNNTKWQKEKTNFQEWKTISGGRHNLFTLLCTFCFHLCLDMSARQCTSLICLGICSNLVGFLERFLERETV